MLHIAVLKKICFDEKHHRPCEQEPVIDNQESRFRNSVRKTGMIVLRQQFQLDKSKYGRRHATGDLELRTRRWREVAVPSATATARQELQPQLEVGAAAQSSTGRSRYF